MSSRNSYLTPRERKVATIIFRALTEAKRSYESGQREAEALRQIIRGVINTEPLVKIEYISCADYETLEELDTVHAKVLLSMAVYVGKTRLIDNFVIG
jgi:pantoate--beta-alanine ligase